MSYLVAVFQSPMQPLILDKCKFDKQTVADSEVWNSSVYLLGCSCFMGDTGMRNIPQAPSLGDTITL